MTRMWTIEEILRLSQLLLKIVVVAAVVDDGSRAFIEEEPVYWADKSTLVYNEYVDVNLDIEILSPCDLKAFPPGFNKSQKAIDKLRSECSKKYHEMFLLQLTERYHCAHEEREAIPIDTGNKNVSVKLALLVGYGSIYSFSSINGDDDISKMKLGNVGMNDLVKMVESKLSEEGSFAELLQLSELTKWDNGWRQKNAMPGPKNFRHWWDPYAIPEEFLHVIGIEDFRKAFGDVLLRPADSLNCSIDLNWTNLNVTISLPKVNRDLQIFHAESFVLTEMSFEHYICELRYNGPKNVVWSTEQNCIFAKDVNEAGYGSWDKRDQRPFFTESNSCIAMPNEAKPYFALHACYKLGGWRPKSFFDSKSVNETEYVYCNGGSVRFPTEDDPAIPCPAFVFRTNRSSRISVNDGDNRRYLTSRVHITVPPASLSQKLNTILFPAGFNTTAILMSQLPILRKEKSTETEKYVVPSAVIAMFIIMGSMILVAISAALMYLFRKFGFTVRTNINEVASVIFWRNHI